MASKSGASPGTRTKVALGQSPSMVSKRSGGDGKGEKGFKLAELPEMTAED